MSIPGFAGDAGLREKKEHYGLESKFGTGRDGVRIIPQQCQPWMLKWTATRCYGFVMTCNDKCGYTPWNVVSESGWYVCGVCFGFPF